ncbi:glycosyl hydrolase [Lentisphaera profundi]|uniref:Glycosyl hydrolase n=1 Tax=Lentisphaera profundi TaxID=1658616 RepID=A0ABY7W328_9BACT|nr:glycosyl hydrolase [Lentisphaera profundi]WDE99401.1 glycosyl hydrolase [Lentisphaera profundi]
MSNEFTGIPSGSVNLDAKPEFKQPPIGYGEVPFWWWTGDDLDEDRLLWQVNELHKKGISGVQVNYSSLDTPAWPTDISEPALFSEGWWKLYSRISEECAKLDMGIGLSTYCLDTPQGAKNLFHELFYSKKELNAIELILGERMHLCKNETKSIDCGEEIFLARAYELKDGVLERGGIDLTHLVKSGELTWTAPAGEWQVWTFATRAQELSLNPLMKGAGDLVIRDFYQKFEDNNPGKTSKGLNYFFNDELQIGVGKYKFIDGEHVIGDGKFAWSTDFAEEFLKRKGYNLYECLPAMWEEMGDVTPKLRIDYADVRMSLMEECYFEPIYHWHASRGLIFGCDQSSRGTQPNEFGDYFRATRWYSAPGHDTPGGQADLIKGKISSSIAQLYQRPRVWLEAYHSIGWGATPERMMHATCENFLYGCTLLNLHGLYYTTYGSHWEWAPPCHHFRMPYWEHMGTFLKYFERLSYLLSQGQHVCDVAVIYPVTPYEAELKGEQSRDCAFAMGRELMKQGINFDFIDHQSLALAEIRGDRLHIDRAKSSYRVLIFPNMKATRWQSLSQAAAFSQAGGTVLSIGDLPEITDRMGRNDERVADWNDCAFKSECRMDSVEQAVTYISKSFVQDVRGLNRTVRALHRKIGFRDVYYTMDAKAGDVVEFRAKGMVELWDPWTGDSRPLRIVQETATGTQVELPLEEYEAQVIVFSPIEKVQELAQKRHEPRLIYPFPQEDWRVTFIATMNNRFGDFRLPITSENKIIGIEARRFDWAREEDIDTSTAMQTSTDLTKWQKQLHGYGPQFYQLGPLPENLDPELIDAQLAKVTQVNPELPVHIDGQAYFWRPYEFSWRYGKENDPGHQGWHGLKNSVAEDFIRLGKTVSEGNGIIRLSQEEHSRYYLWTSAIVSAATLARLHVAKNSSAEMPNTSPTISPAAIFVNGGKIQDQTLSLHQGANPLLIRFDTWGQSHVVLRKQDTPLPAASELLAMRWYKDPAVIPFDIYAGESSAQWFSFNSAPGTSAIQLQAESSEPIQAWMDGVPMFDQGEGYFLAPKPAPRSALITLRVQPRAGCSGGEVIPEPIRIETNGQGLMPLGDWSKFGVLNNYSGGVRYRKQFTLTEQQTEGEFEFDLGRVSATVELWVNGQKAGVRVAPPWKIDVSGLLQAGENEVEIIVYNALANHYQTIPSLYKGDPISGLFGPVKLLRKDKKRVVKDRLILKEREK